MHPLFLITPLAMMLSTGIAIAKPDKLTRIMGFGGVCSDCDLSKKNLSGANMNGASFPRSDFTAADLSNAKLRGSNFSRAIFRRADLSGSSATGSNFSWADFSGATLDNMNGNGNNFSRATLNGAKGKSADLVAANFSYAKLLGTSFQDAEFSYSNFSNTDFSGAKLNEARFEMSNLSFVNFGASDLSNVEFNRVDLQNARFDNTLLTGVVFTEAFLPGADLSKARGLTAEQFASACGDSKTRLPEGLSLADCNTISWSKQFTRINDNAASFNQSRFGNMRNQDVLTIHKETKRALNEGRRALLEAGRALAVTLENPNLENLTGQQNLSVPSKSTLLQQHQQRSLDRIIRSLTKLRLSSGAAQSEIDQAIIELKKAQEIMKQKNQDMEIAVK